MTTPVSEFYAKIGIDVDKKSLKGVDKFFSDLEKRLGAVGSTLASRKGAVEGVQQLTKETKTLAQVEKSRNLERIKQSNQIVQANRRVTQSEKKLSEIIDQRFGIGGVQGGLSRADRQRQYNSIFSINSNLKRVSGRGAVNNLSRLSSVESQVRSKVGKTDSSAAQAQLQAAKLQLQAANLAQRTQQIQMRENIARLNLDRIKETRLLENDKWARKEDTRLRKEAARARVSEARIKRGNYLAMGGAGGALARYGLASLPFVGGMYGMASLNRANQTLMSTEISAGSIFGSRADEMKAWLKNHANYVGYNYLETMPIFSQFMGSAKHTMGMDAGRDVFEGLTEFGRTRGSDKVGMQRAMRALGQMSAKGKVTSEELRQQLSEATGFGESVPIFAEAWQILNGGDLKGSAATDALLTAMERGQVYSDKILPVVGKLMKASAASGIDAARTSSIAEQARAENAQTASLDTFSKNGGEAGFARFWQTIAWAMKELEPLVKGMAGTFERLAVVLQAPVRLLGSMGSVVSYLSRETGLAEKNITTFIALGGLMATKWGRATAQFTALLLVLEDIAFGVMGKDSLTKDAMEWIQKVMGFEVDKTKGIFALAGAFLALNKAMKMLHSYKDLANILGGGNDSKGGKGGMGKAAAGGAVAGGLLSSSLMLPVFVVGGSLFLMHEWGVVDSLADKLSSRLDNAQTVQELNKSGSWTDTITAPFNWVRGYYADENTDSLIFDAMNRDFFESKNVPQDVIDTYKKNWSAGSPQSNIVLGKGAVEANITINNDNPQQAAQVFKDELANALMEMEGGG